MPSLSVLHILRTIKDRGTVSRTELQHTTGLSWGTITNTTRELLNRNLIREEGALSTKAGRKPVRLAINPASHSLIGIDLAPDIVRCTALNLAGETLGYEELAFDRQETPGAVLERIGGDLVQRLLDLPIMNARNCLGIGVAVPGALDEARGTLRQSPRLAEWHGVPIRQYLQEAASLPVRMERDHTCLALAERWFGEAGHADDVLCVNLGETVGLGILSGGEIFRGSQQAAGDFGHVTIDPHGPPCGCGDRGCVECYASLSAVREYVRSLTEKHSPALAAIFAARTPTRSELLAAASTGDAATLAAFTRMGKYLGIGVANLIDLFNPHLIILAGPMAQASEFFLPALGEEVERHTAPTLSRRILPSQLGERATAMGACGIVLQTVFEPGQIASPELQRA